MGVRRGSKHEVIDVLRRVYVVTKIEVSATKRAPTCHKG